jgi:hypothetical protein
MKNIFQDKYNKILACILSIYSNLQLISNQSPSMHNNNIKYLCVPINHVIKHIFLTIPRINGNCEIVLLV